MDEFKVWEINLEYFLKGNQSAIRYCEDLLQIAHTWDDLIDKDKPITDVDINNAFQKATVDLPLNPFYEAFKLHLIPLWQNVILQWEVANIMDKSHDEIDLKKAWMLRAGIYQIVAYCAYLVGGMEWYRKVGFEVWKSYGETPESIKEE